MQFYCEYAVRAFCVHLSACTTKILESKESSLLLQMCFQRGRGSQGAEMVLCGSFQTFPRSVCSPDQYLGLLHRTPPLHLNVNADTGEYDCSFVSAGVFLINVVESSPTFHEWNRKQWTVLLPNMMLFVCSWENIVLQMPSFKYAISVQLKGVKWQERGNSFVTWALLNPFAHLSSLEHTIYNCQAR